MDDVLSLLKRLPARTVIPKPETDGLFEVKGWGTRRGEEALIYRIPNHRTPSRPHEKGITIPEFRAAHQELCSSGRLTTAWFKANLTACWTEGSCNFTTVGGLFELLELAVRDKRGAYLRKPARD